MNHSEVPSASFEAMIRPPAVAWPTVVLFFACMLGLGTIDYMALLGEIPLVVATLVNGFITYFLFSVVHDSAHGAISKNKRFNDLLGHIAIFFFGPLAPLNFARWIHMQHHRFTNDHDKDPDSFGHKLDFWALFRWTNFDYFYTKFFLEQAGPMRKKFMGRLVVQIVLVAVIVAAACWFGYGLEVLMLWILPTRISSALFITFFVYLPHAPFKATAKQDEYQASNIRAGWEWLLTPLMTFQNYHLVHHLYPTAPFYRMIKIWRTRLDHHLAQDPFYVDTFSVGKSVNPPSKK